MRTLLLASLAALSLAAPASAMGVGITMDLPSLWWPEEFTGAPSTPAPAAPVKH